MTRMNAEPGPDDVLELECTACGRRLYAPLEFMEALAALGEMQEVRLAVPRHRACSAPMLPKRMRLDALQPWVPFDEMSQMATLLDAADVFDGPPTAAKELALVAGAHAVGAVHSPGSTASSSGAQQPRQHRTPAGQTQKKPKKGVQRRAQKEQQKEQGRRYAD